MANGTNKTPEVVVIGGGFAGLNVTTGLKNAPVLITLIDKHNYHLFQPLLYQVATGVLAGSNIAAPIRRVLRGQKNARVALSEIIGVDLARKMIIGRRGNPMIIWYWPQG